MTASSPAATWLRGARRISVVGVSGAGKTVLARALAAVLGLGVTELDAIYHLSGWQPLDESAFRARVAAITSADAWVVDGNYTAVLDIVWDRADTVVVLDPPRAVVMRQLLWRTVTRAVTRRVLWNGNREQWRNVVHWDPERSILRWAWTRHGPYRRHYRAAAAAPRNAHLHFVFLRSRRDVRALLAAVSASGR